MVAIDPVRILLPVLAVVLLTVAAFFRMAAARAVGLKQAPRDPSYYRAFLGAPEPEPVVAAVRHYGNLFEVPTLFYAACILAFQLGAVGAWSLGWAWAYVAARIAQSLIHMSYNNPAHRGLAFVLGWFCVIALWVCVALAVFARL